MPSTIRLPHLRQEHDYSCLPACARMILAGLGQDLPESRLRALLKTRASVGTHPIHFRNLDALGVEAVWPYPASLSDVRQLVERGLPVIVFLWTGVLRHWPPTSGVDYLHTAIVIGFSATGPLIHDPKLDYGPIEIVSETFSEAWASAGNLIAYIRPRQE